MAANFIQAKKDHSVINFIIQGARLLRESEVAIAAALAGMAAMIDGDGKDAAQFTLMASKCEIAQNDFASANAAAKKLFDEINSVAGNAAPAIAAAKQLCAYLGV